MMLMPVAFRCRKCGHLTPALHAGEQDVPHACQVCGGGVRYSERGNREFEPSNWEVLARATPERLAELGLSLDDVEKHTPVLKGEYREPRHFIRTATDGSSGPDTVTSK